MALFTTDFTEYTTGVQPADWTRRYDLTGDGWTVESDPTSNSGQVLRFADHEVAGGARRGISWDDIDPDPDRDDVEILMRVRAATITDSVIDAFARGTGSLAAITTYAIGHRHQPLETDTDIIRYVSGTATVLDTAVENIGEDIWYWIRIQVIGTVQRVRTWLLNESEPATWAAEANDANVTGVGWVGVFSFADLPFDIDFFGVGTNGDPVPIPIITGSVELDLEVEVDVVGRAGASIEIQLAGVIDLDVSPLVQISIEMSGGGTIDAAGFRPLPSRTIFTTAIELWSDLRVAGGERIAILSDFESVLSGTYRRTLDRDDELEITIPQSVMRIVGSVPGGVSSQILVQPPIEISDTPHDEVVVSIVSFVPAGASVFLEFSTAPNPVVTGIADDAGTSYVFQAGAGASHLYKGFLTSPLNPGDSIVVSYGGDINATTLIAYYVLGLDPSTTPVDSSHVLVTGGEPNYVTAPINVPEGGIAIAAAYQFGTVVNAFTQDPNFTSLATGQSEAVSNFRWLNVSSRRQSGNYAYDPTIAGSSAIRLTIASYAPVGTVPVRQTQLGKASEVELEQVIRVDDGFHPATWWRLKERRDGRGIDTGTMTLVGKSVHTELSRALIKEIPPRGGSLRIRAKGQRFVSEWFSAVIFPALELEGIDWVVLNQNDFANVFLEFDIPNATALLLLNEIETAVGGEWNLTDAGEFFALDLVREIGVGTPERLISFGRNLLHITDDLEHGQTYGTVIVPTGAVDSELGPATVAENAWEIESRSGDVVVLVDPAGGDGPAQFDDQFSPPGVVLPVYHLYTSIFGVIGFPLRRDILDTVVLDARRTQLTVDDASGLSAGDIVRIDPIPELIGVP